MRLLPFICVFKPSDLKASLLMTFVCDVIIWVSFEVSFTHLYVLEVWQSRMRLCLKRLYFHVCALFFSSSSTLSLPQKITEIRLSKPYSGYSLFFKRIWNSVRFFYQTLSVTNLVFGGVTFRESRICILGNHMILSAIWNK